MINRKKKKKVCFVRRENFYNTNFWLPLCHSNSGVVKAQGSFLVPHLWHTPKEDTDQEEDVSLARSLLAQHPRVGSSGGAASLSACLSYRLPELWFSTVVVSCMVVILHFTF